MRWIIHIKKSHLNIHCEDVKIQPPKDGAKKCDFKFFIYQKSDRNEIN